MNKQLSILSAALLAMSVSASAHALNAGDIAVIAYNSDGDDNFAWVALTDIAANTSINFTDSSWQDFSSGAFRSSEHLDVSGGGRLTWINTSLLSAGSVVTYSGKVTANWSVGSATGGFLNLSNDGDQIFVYQGADASPSFIYGLQFAHGTGIIASPTVSNSTNTTNIPGALSESADTMFNVGNSDNGFYSGVTSGTRDELIIAIGNTSNWTTSNSNTATTNWDTAFAVTAPVPEADTYALMLAGMGLVGFLARRRKI
jgi:hypothetical protein